MGLLSILLLLTGGAGACSESGGGDAPSSDHRDGQPHDAETPDITEEAPEAPAPDAPPDLAPDDDLRDEDGPVPQPDGDGSLDSADPRDGDVTPPYQLEEYADMFTGIRPEPHLLLRRHNLS